MRLDLDRVNRRVYASRGAVRQYASAGGWLDAGERSAIAQAAQRLDGGRVLDLGVGGGRTAPLLRKLGGGYVGVDYTPGLVEVARRRFPDLDLREMDARRLDFPDGSFGLVVFTYNGIDSIDLPGRAQVLREVHRVLAPGGAFVFSSLNRDGPAFGEPPWIRDRHWRGPVGWLRQARRTALALWNERRNRSLFKDYGDVALGPISGHDFGMVTVFTSLATQTRQLEDTGFAVEAVLDAEAGRQVAAGPDARGASWFYYIARKPAAADTEPGPARFLERCNLAAD